MKLPCTRCIGFSRSESPPRSGRSLAASLIHGDRLKPIHRAQRGGFVLLEIVFALALFGIVCVSLTQALQQIARTSQVSKKEGQVIRVMESVLAEVAHAPEFKPGSVSFDAGADGVEARASISLVKPYTKNKQLLDHMFRIHVEAWIPDGREKTVLREMETFVYSPNSRES